MPLVKHVLDPDVRTIDVEFDVAAARPTPVDSVSLAHWLGTTHKNLWWLVTQRKEMYRVWKIPKGDGRYRHIHEPLGLLKHIQAVAATRILSTFPTADHVGAYEEGKGVKYSASRHAGHNVILELDIKDFFGSTRRLFVREFLLGAGWKKEPAFLLSDLLTYPIKKDLSVVPQGAPSSPQLCNLIGNQRFDQSVIQMLQQQDSGWLYTRYSDNLIISHPDQRERAEVDVILRAVDNIVYKSGYRINPKKMKVMRSTNKKFARELLGLSVSKVPQVEDSTYRKLRAMTHNASRNGFSGLTNLPKAVKTPEQAAAHLNGVVNYYLYMNRSPKMERLKRLLDDAVKRHLAVNQVTYVNGEEVKTELSSPKSGDKS